MTATQFSSPPTIVADYHIDRMKAVLATLKWLEANVETVRGAVKKAQEAERTASAAPFPPAG